jgi:alpha-tubulin suppressor-like RCC1 family protein
VFAFGDHSRGQLGLGTDIKTLNIQEPHLIESLSRYFITYVACGESHTAFISSNHALSNKLANVFNYFYAAKGHLFTCGNNSNDRLGLSKNVNQFSPVRVDKYKDLIMKDVSCGGSHTVAIGNPSDRDLNETESDNEYELKRTASLSRAKRNEKIVISLI